MLAALPHVWIFRLEPITQTQPATWKRFSTTSQSDADTTWPLACNQGFHNLFLAPGSWPAAGAIALGHPAAGWILVFSSCGSMLLAAIVLALSGRKYLRAAATQGATPLLAVVLGALGLLAA
ncbi:DUF1304 domain-containing protein [Arthrobacter sp. CG_A4]|uniref:DUF1304 domain-containing protein n=1 Tax=Arthrobacter sp. CG_A4 TaxID=3071706 RepID=UPI002E0F9D28